ncbi:hypothetical protein EI94DRAFT_1793944 [Lactarius quietus]|nr:hypothetical protein EI94DRAFT_1793944 [Lactarius quietus]
MSYKTTPCRHFTRSLGRCPWGDDCCFIHDPALEWVFPPERGSSGRSPPGSTTLVDTMAGAAEPGAASRSSSSQSAHCWGYIQGLCPRPDETCKFIHPPNVVPYIKYTPCLTWPRCGYPTQACPLKHPASRQGPNTRTARRPAATAAVRRVAYRHRPGSASLAHHPARRSIRERRVVPQSDATFSGHVRPSTALCRRALEPPHFGGLVGGRRV